MIAVLLSLCGWSQMTASVLSHDANDPWDNPSEYCQAGVPTPRLEARRVSALSVREVNVQGDFVPLPTQLSFASSTYRHRAYIGAVGSGKSEILCRVVLDLAVKVPGNRIVIGRYTFRDFQRTTRTTLERVMIPEIIERQLPGGDGWVIRTSDPDNPTTLYTAHYDEPGAFTSMGLGAFACDEVNGDDLSPSVPEAVWRMLCARLGRDVPHVKRPYGLLAGNPGGHSWPWKYHHPDSPNRLEDAWMWTPAAYENSGNLPTGYYERLERNNGADWVSRYVHGSHEVFEGQVYPELSESRECVDPFPIPETWPRIVYLDHGQRNPTAVGFMAINEDGVVFLYDEHYEANRPISYHAEKIKLRLPAMAKAREIRWPADPSIFAKTMQKAGKTFSVFDEYAEYGLDSWEPGENDVSAGRNRIKEHLKAGKLKFFRGRVPNAWREITQLHWRRVRSLVDRDAPEDEADVDNHHVDGIRYALMTRPESADKPAIVETPKSPGGRIGERASKAYRKAVRERQRREEGPTDYV